MGTGKFFGNWTPDHAAALDAWKAFCLAAGIDINVRMPGQAVRPSEGIALLQALRYALKGTQTGTANAPPSAPTNPIRSLREGAGLSQSQLAALMGISKRAVQLQEMRPAVSAEMVARVKRAIGKAGA